MPTGWVASCGGTGTDVIAYAYCVDPDDEFDLTSCHVVKQSGTSSVGVACPSGEFAVSPGGYCGSSWLRTMTLDSDLQGDLDHSVTGCAHATSSVNAYAICCEGILD